MVRQKIEQYLDGELDGAEAAALLSNPAHAKLLERARQERVLRSAVYASYQPSFTEADALASKVLAACAESAHAPLASIGRWWWRASAAAAVLALTIGAFVAGRATAPTPGPTVAGTSPQGSEIVRVLYSDDAGEPQMKEFDNMDDANGFMKEMTARHAEPVAVAGNFDPNGSGSF